MPVHDWARVDANVFHHFHQRWTIAICDALNAGLLPAGYSALVEQHAGGLVPDVLTLERRSRPNRPAEPGGGIVTATPPKTRLVKTAKAVLAAREPHRHPPPARRDCRRRGDRLTWKQERPRSAAGLRGQDDRISRQGVHLLVIDILPPTRAIRRAYTRRSGTRLKRSRSSCYPANP